MTKKISGCYYNIANRNDKIKIDLDGHNPLFVISGTITHKLFDNTHWLADIEKTANGSYEGDICYTSGYLNNFHFRKVSVFLDQQGHATVRFYILEKAYTHHYKKSDDYFRHISLSYCHQKGITPVRSFRPDQHIDHNTKLVGKEVTFQKVFEKAGLKITEDRQDRELEITDASSVSWTDRELHNAMKSYWSGYSENPQWAMWVFTASSHHHGDHIQGKMFDKIGDQHRQGVAVFYHAIERNVPGSERYSSHRESWIKRQKFWATCHEIGHGLNLYHSWQREDILSWMPLQNESHLASFMNYPDKYPGKSRQYFRDFMYEFSKSEVLFLRHSPDHFIRMGDARWYDIEGFNHLVSNQDMQLISDLRKPVYDFMETVFLDLTLINIGADDITVPENILTDDAYLTIVIRKKNNDATLYEKLNHECGYYGMIRLEKGGGAASFIKHTVQISIGKKGWYISDPGEYTVHAAVYYQEHVSIAQPVRFTVRTPIGEYAEKLAQDHFTLDTADTLYYYGDKTDKFTNDHLKRMVELIPEQNASIHARLALAMPDIQPFRVIDHQTQRIKVLQPSQHQAIDQMKKVLDHSGSRDSLGYNVYHNYAQMVTDMEGRMNW